MYIHSPLVLVGQLISVLSSKTEKLDWEIGNAFLVTNQNQLNGKNI